MSSRYEVEVTISSAKDIKNVNWRHGPNRPYAVVWVDPKNKCSTKVDDEGDTCPLWDEKLVIPLPTGPIDDDTKLFIDIVHAGPEEDTRPLIGSARLSLREVLDDAGLGSPVQKTLKLKRPSGRPHGKLDVTVEIRDPYRYPAPRGYDAPPYGVPPPQRYGDSQAPLPQYGYPYGAPPSGNPYGSSAPPPGGYPYGSPAYGQASYGQAPYGEGYAHEEKKGSKFGGMGTGLAVGAAAGVLGGLALAEGVDALEDHIADEAAEKVEDDLGYDDDGGDDF